MDEIFKGVDVVFIVLPTSIFNIHQTSMNWNVLMSMVGLMCRRFFSLIVSWNSGFILVSLIGTKNVLGLCIKHNVSRLIYTSSASVALSGYLGKAPFAVVVNQTESRIKPASCDSDLIIPGYAVTKNRAERIILGANGANLANGTGNFIKNSTFFLQSMQQSFDYFCFRRVIYLCNTANCNIWRRGSIFLSNNS